MQALRPFSGLLPGLFQAPAFVLGVLTGFGIVRLNFLPDGGTLHLPQGLPPVLHAAVQVHLSDVAGLNRTRSATIQRKHHQRKYKQPFYCTHGTLYEVSI